MGKHAWAVFEGIQEDVTTGVKVRKALTWINYMKLGKGEIAEVRFVLGQIIIDTLASTGSAKSELTKLKLRINESELENRYKQSKSPYSNELLPDKARKARMLRDDDKIQVSESPGQNLAPSRLKNDDGVNTKAVLSRKMASKSPGQDVAPSRLKKDKHVKSGTQKTAAPLSDLVACRLKKDEDVKSGTQKTAPSLSDLVSCGLKKDEHVKTG